MPSCSDVCLPASSINSVHNKFIQRTSKRKNTKHKVTRKRVHNKALWIDAQAKKARIAGAEGSGRNNIKIKPREMGDGCNDECRRQCANKITEEGRKSAFALFWSLGSRTNQWNCINNWVKPVKIKKSKKEDDSTTDSDFNDDSDEKSKKKKSLINEFTLSFGDKKIVVCKTMFLDTLGKILNIIILLHKN